MLSGKTLGPYRVVERLGGGGMGEVYKARDTRLDRTVAIKVLRDTLAADPQFRARFDREARAISQLAHPHICTLYDVGEAPNPEVPASSPEPPATIQFLVMELLEGDTLEQRLKKGALPLEEALTIAIAIASALDTAHRAGITHRDLKPGNIMLTKTGAKLLDFGLAKASAPAVAGAALSSLPTRPPNLTAQGTILGTLQYMAPEQLEGQEADARTDLFAFGSVVYEALTGRKAFEGQGEASLIVAIMHADPPPISRMQPATPPALDRIVRRCLAKDPDRRWQNAGDLMAELQWIATDAAGRSHGVPVEGRRETSWGRMVVGAGAALVVAVAVGFGGWVFGRRAPTQAKPIRFVVLPPEDNPFATSDGPALLSISPDGQRLAFVAEVNGHRSLWVRPLESLTARKLPGTDDAWQPAWSPDSRHLAFSPALGGGRVKRIDAAGGPPVTLYESPRGLSRAAWSAQGVVLVGGPDGRLYRVPDSGGPPTPVTELDRALHETAHAWPVFLPDGRRFVFLARSTDAAHNGLYLASLDGPGRTHLINALSSVEYAPGYLLYQRDGTLMAQPFDEKQGRLTGDPAPIVEGLLYNPGNGRAAMSVSSNGVLVYRTGAVTGTRLLTWFDATGKVLGTVGAAGLYYWPRVSPDGRRVVVDRTEPGARSDLWMIDVERGVPTRLTSDPADDGGAVWSPDGARLVFQSNRRGVYDLYQRGSGGAAADEVLFESPEAKAPTGFSPDGRLLLFNRTMGADKKVDVWALPLSGDRRPIPVISTAFNEDSAVFSPDGRWIAYASDDSGEKQVYVAAYPWNGVTVRLSTTTGSAPAWSADGKTVIYPTSNFHLMAVDVAVAGAELRAGVPRELFAWNGGAGLGPGSQNFGSDPSGRRYLIPVVTDDQAAAPITVVLNWDAALKK